MNGWAEYRYKRMARPVHMALVVDESLMPRELVTLLAADATTGYARGYVLWSALLKGMVAQYSPSIDKYRSPVS